MNIQKLNGVLINFDLIKHDFSSNIKRKNCFLCTKNCFFLSVYCFGPRYKFERNGPKIPFLGSNWIRKFLYGLFFVSSTIFKLQAVLHDAAESVKSTTQKRPVFVMFYLDFLALVFLVTRPACS